MRMWDITILIVCFELAIGFAGGLVDAGLFDNHMYYTQSQQSVTSGNGFMSGEISNTGELISSTQTSNVDYFSMGISMVWSAIGIITKTIYSVLFFLPHLRETFMFPLELAIPIQVLIYITYAWGIAQFLSGRSGGMLQ